MNKKLFVLLIVLFVFLGFPRLCFAESVKYVDQSNSNNYVIIDKKGQVTAKANGRIVINSQCHISKFGFDKTSIDFVTEEIDTTLKSDDQWWATLYECKVNGVYAIYTDSLSVMLGKNRSCQTYVATEVSEDKLTSYCGPIEKRLNEVVDLYNKYKKDPKPAYAQKYDEYKEEIKSLCATSIEQADYNDACVNRCLTIGYDYETWDQAFVPGSGHSDPNCSFSDKLIGFLANIVKWIKFIVPVLVIVLGILDFIKATATDKEDEMKKAQSKFVKRLIAAALIFLVPLILEFILPKMGFNYIDCGLNF